MLPEKLPHMHLFTVKLSSFIAMIHLMCLEFLGQDSDVLHPYPLTQVYVVITPWQTSIIRLGWLLSLSHIKW